MCTLAVDLKLRAQRKFEAEGKSYRHRLANMEELVQGLGRRSGKATETCMLRQHCRWPDIPEVFGWMEHGRPIFWNSYSH